jgi:hypothetical protein
MHIPLCAMTLEGPMVVQHRSYLTCPPAYQYSGSSAIHARHLPKAETAMNRYPQPYVATQLMTVEEAKRLSTLDGCELRRQEKQRARMWSWQTIEGAMSQSISDDQVEELQKHAR